MAPDGGPDASTPDVGAPRRIAGLPAAAQIAVGRAHACARSEAGELWCWGRNPGGQLGRGETSVGSTTPARVEGLSPVTSVALAHDTSCAVVEDGGVECWGDNSDRHASPRGLLSSAVAVPVDRSRLTYIDTK